jgi:hypothetical protein
MFSVVKYDYKSGIFFCVGEYPDKRHALLALEEYVIDYIAKRDGVTKITDVEKKGMEELSDHEKFKKICFAADKFDLRGMPVGHYIRKDPHDHVNKLEIWQKEKKVRQSLGYIYNSCYIDNCVSKVFDIDILLTGHKQASMIYSKDVEIDMKYKDARVAANLLWGNYTKSLVGSAIFKKLAAMHSDNNQYIYVRALHKEFPDSFKKYIKKTNKLSTTNTTNENLDQTLVEI